jgi:cell division transport system permease protein
MTSEKVQDGKDKRLVGPYFSTTISIAMILFLFGLLGLLLVNAQRLSEFMKENIGVALILKESAKEADVMKLQKTLETNVFIKSTKFVGKDRAAAELKKELGEDFIDFLGYNPLLSSIDLTIHAAYANPDSLAKLETRLLTHPEIQEVYYQRTLVSQLSHNVEKISLILLSLSILMLIIFVALINNTIRSSIYSKRFVINTMLLVGATQSFVKRPFLVKSALHGVYGALIACGMFLLLYIAFQNELKSFIEFQNSTSIILLGGGIFSIGIIMSLISTHLAVNKFLRMDFDQLYY